jgi:hypothetical protein
MTETERQRDLKALQDAIYRGKVERARGMTEQQRFEEVFELTDGVLSRMLSGAMWQLGTESRAEGEAELVRRIDRLRWVRDRERIGPEPQMSPVG